MTEAIETPSDRRPVGLVVLACIQFFFGAVALAALAAPLGPGLYAILSPLITGIAMVATGIGYLRRSWTLGFLGGNILAFGTLANILVFNLLEGFANFPIHLPSMVYPVLLLAFLNLRYKPAFESKRAGA
jgi:hypothetical protein